VIKLLTALWIAVGLCAAGCDSIDPTEQFFTISFVNDLPGPVTLKTCSDDACTHFTPGTVRLDAGERSQDGISDRDFLTRWAVLGADGQKLGCLPLQFNARYADVVVLLSRKVPCPGSRPLRVRHGRKVGDRI
jgi:hypothetical protein